MRKIKATKKRCTVINTDKEGNLIVEKYGLIGHREVAGILQSPGEWMIPVDKEKSRRSVSECSENEDHTEPKGDPEMAPIYLKRLLPVFCQTFQATMLPSVRKASLGLIKKMIHYIQPNLLEEICRPESPTYNFGTQLVEVIATVLDNEVSLFFCFFNDFFFLCFG